MSIFNKLTYHIIFGTKFREGSILPHFQEKLYQYIGGIIKSFDGHLIEIGGIEDHIHILATLSAKKPISDALREIKASSSKWINKQAFTNFQFSWQKGYGIFTVSYSQVELVRGYILNQREHHQKTAVPAENLYKAI